MPTDENVTERYVLFTNIDYAIVGGVRTYARALLLAREKHPLDERRPRFLLRGFSTHRLLALFDAVVPSDEFELVPAHDDQFWIESEGGGQKPLFRGAILKIAGAPNVHLIAGVNSSEAIDTHRFPEGTNLAVVYRMLEEKVAGYWTAPYMVLPWQAHISEVRRTHQARGTPTDAEGGSA